MNHAGYSCTNPNGIDYRDAYYKEAIMIELNTYFTKESSVSKIYYDYGKTPASLFDKK